MDEDGTPMGAQRKLMRNAPAGAIMHNQGNAASKLKAKTNGKILRQVPSASPFRDDASTDAS
jgi:hypothetical protein